MKPSPVLGARLRLTTKQVNGGYYKGTRTGSMGAHTEYGGYIIDYRKVRHYNAPDLTGFKLTPFVSKEMEPTPEGRRLSDGTLFNAQRVDGMEYLRQWKHLNLEAYNNVVQYQEDWAANAAAEEEEVATRQLETSSIADDEPSKVNIRGREESPFREDKR